MHTANLQAFIAVADTASFTRAAEQLHITQPAISKRIAALEDELAARLFDRVGHNTLLTEAGDTLLPRARRILAELDDSRRAILNLSGKISGSISLGTSHHIGLHRLPTVLRQFTQTYPDVELDLHFMSSEDIAQAVIRGELELGLSTLPKNLAPQLQSTPLWRDPLCFACALHHPLAGQASILPSDLAKYRALLPAPNTATRAILDDALRDYQVELHTGIATNYLETIKMMVSVGLGWTLLPLTMTDQQIKLFNVKGISLARTLGIITHTNRTRTNAANAFINCIRAP